MLYPTPPPRQYGGINKALLFSLLGLVVALGIFALFALNSDMVNIGQGTFSTPQESAKRKAQALHAKVTTKGNEASQSESICLIEAQYFSSYPHAVYVDSRSTKAKGDEWIIFVKTNAAAANGDNSIFTCVTRLRDKMLSVKSFNAIRDTENRYRSRMFGFE